MILHVALAGTGMHTGLTDRYGAQTARVFWLESTYEERATPVETARTQHCAGALILLEKLHHPSQLMRIFERLDGYDRSKLDMAAPVYDTFAAMREGCGAADSTPTPPRKHTGRTRKATAQHA